VTPSFEHPLLMVNKLYLSLKLLANISAVRYYHKTIMMFSAILSMNIIPFQGTVDYRLRILQATDNALQLEHVQARVTTSQTRSANNSSAHTLQLF
jgi:hypothetical protein